MATQMPSSREQVEAPRKLYLGAAVAMPMGVALWVALVASIMWRL